MIVKYTEYNGNPIITLKRNQDERWPFSFGLSKAKRILECYDDIKKFVAEHESEMGPEN